MLFNGGAMVFTLAFAVYALVKFAQQIGSNMWGSGFYFYYYCCFCAKKRDTLATLAREEAAFPSSPNDNDEEITVVVGVPKARKAFELGETVVCPKCRTEQMAVLPGYVECPVCRVRPYKRGTKHYSMVITPDNAIVEDKKKPSKFRQNHPMLLCFIKSMICLPCWFSPICPCCQNKADVKPRPPGYEEPPYCCFGFTDRWWNQTVFKKAVLKRMEDQGFADVEDAGVDSVLKKLEKAKTLKREIKTLLKTLDKNISDALWMPAKIETLKKEIETLKKDQQIIDETTELEPEPEPELQPEPESEPQQTNIKINSKKEKPQKKLDTLKKKLKKLEELKSKIQKLNTDEIGTKDVRELLWLHEEIEARKGKIEILKTEQTNVKFEPELKRLEQEVKELKQVEVNLLQGKVDTLKEESKRIKKKAKKEQTDDDKTKLKELTELNKLLQLVKDLKELNVDDDLEAQHGRELADLQRQQVRKTPTWPRSWANFSLL
jgi:hypothetical protein